MTNNTPVDHVRIGAISAAIWANDTEKGVRYGVTIERLYRDPESGEWRSSSTFNRDDLLPAGKVLDLAHTRIVELQSLARAQDRPSVNDTDVNGSKPESASAKDGAAKATRAKARAAGAR